MLLEIVGRSRECQGYEIFFIYTEHDILVDKMVTFMLANGIIQ